MENIALVISNLISTNLIAKSVSEKLKLYHEYLKTDIQNSEPKFITGELKLMNMVKYTINDNPKGLKKIMPFLISRSMMLPSPLLCWKKLTVLKKETMSSILKHASLSERLINYLPATRFRTGFR